MTYQPVATTLLIARDYCQETDYGISADQLRLESGVRRALHEFWVLIQTLRNSLEKRSKLSLDYSLTEKLTERERVFSVLTPAALLYLTK